MDDPAQPPPSNPPGAPVPEAAPPPQTPPLTYEETPEIVTDVTSGLPAQAGKGQETSEVPKKHSGSCLKTIGIILLVAMLFAGGIWLSSFVRQFLPPAPSAGTPATGTVTPTPSTAPDPYATWKSYGVTSGVTRALVSGLQYKLPPDVTPPICDGACVSQGTSLPGGTRLTVAARGAGQSLRDFRGAVITDANGIPIPTKQLTLPGFSAMVYESSASGRTVSGYEYTRIRGVMIALTDTLSVEVNHFTPSGISADFAADDTLFDSIIQTFTYTSTPSATATPPSTATSSGY